MRSLSSVTPRRFSSWQPAYAEHGIAIFPVQISRDAEGKASKVPLVRNYQRFGVRGSAAIAHRFSDASAFGFMAGKHSRITALDVDTNDERVLADALDTHGKTKVITRSGGSGNYQAWYRYNGEKRAIRRLGDKPIDVLGRGVVVAPPSKGLVRSYEFLEGGLDDLERLPTLSNLPAHIYSTEIRPPGEQVRKGERNDTLYGYCMRAARHCDDFDALLDVAITRNSEFIPPLDDEEVTKVVQQAWGYTERGENYFGQPKFWFGAQEMANMLAHQDAFLLLAFLRFHNGPDATFWCTNGLADKFAWTPKRMAAARRRLIELDYLVPVRQAGYRHPALFRWQAK